MLYVSKVSVSRKLSVVLDNIDYFHTEIVQLFKQEKASKYAHSSCMHIGITIHQHSSCIRNAIHLNHEYSEIITFSSLFQSLLHIKNRFFSSPRIFIRLDIIKIIPRIIFSSIGQYFVSIPGYYQ